MPAKSITLAEKIAARFIPDSDLMDVSALLKTAKSANRFDSLDDFKAHLAEGALLNVSVLGSKALSVPCGEYMVWMTDMGHTMLVPTTSKPGPKEVFEQNRDQYEIQTKDLLKNWNRLERTIAEDNMQRMQNLQQGGNNEENLEEPEDGDPEEGRAGEFRNTIDMSTVDRPTIARAMTDRGYTVTSLASEVGVQAPAISRILRTPEQTQGDPGGRNPSIGLASEICRVLRLDPTVAFPDIFSPQTRYEPRQSRTSSPTEAIDDTLAYLDCIPIIEGIATYGFVNFWNNQIIPAIGSISTKTTLNEFIVAVRRQPINEATVPPRPPMKAAVPPRPPMKAAVPPRPPMKAAVPIPSPVTAKPTIAKPAIPSAEDPRVKAAISKMNMAIMPELKKSFAQAMKTLKEQLQQAQYKIGANPKIAPHAWEIMNRFYKTVMQAGMNYEPKWNASAKGSTPTYMGSFQQASANANKAQGPAVANSLLGRDD